MLWCSIVGKTGGERNTAIRGVESNVVVEDYPRLGENFYLIAIKFATKIEFQITLDKFRVFVP